MTTTFRETMCPGCGIRIPADEHAVYDGYYKVSPECWMLCTQVLGAEFGNALLYGQVHQLTVDAYAVQHAGGRHPDKSVAIHLCGLHLVLDRGFRPPRVPPLHKRLADTVKTWPHFTPPADPGPLTVSDVARAESIETHIETVQGWARSVWQAWSPHHADVAAFAARHLGLDD